MKADKKFVEWHHQVSDEEFDLFAGKKAPLFYKARDYLLGLKKSIDFSLPAFLLGPFYYAYHKIWSLVLVLIGVMVFFDMAKVPINPTSSGIAMGTASAMVFRTLYLKRAYKKIAMIKRTETNPEILAIKIKEAGATSWGSVFLCLLLFALYGYISVTYINPQVVTELAETSYVPG